jgi:hypothetical protein
MTSLAELVNKSQFNKTAIPDNHNDNDPVAYEIDTLATPAQRFYV